MCLRESPGDAEADRAHVGEHIVEQVVAPSSGLQVDVELGELQLDVIDVVEEQNQNPDVVIPDLGGEIMFGNKEQTEVRSGPWKRDDNLGGLS